MRAGPVAQAFALGAGTVALASGRPASFAARSLVDWLRRTLLF